MRNLIEKDVTAIGTIAETAARGIIGIIGITAAIHPDPEKEDPIDETVSTSATIVMAIDINDRAIQQTTVTTKAIPINVDTDPRARRNRPRRKN